jgi:hypothetical protein
MEDDSLSSTPTHSNDLSNVSQNAIQDDEHDAVNLHVDQPSTHDSDSSITATGSNLATSDPKADPQVEELPLKKIADSHLSNNGFVRVRVAEFGRSSSNLKRDDLYMVFVQRDGHCMFHSLLGILHARFPLSEIKTMPQLRDALASYFESQGNELQILLDDNNADSVISFSCESIECLRSGKDETDDMRHFGGIPELVAFSYRFGISLEIFTPETNEGTFICRGGGKTDCVPEGIILLLGWYGKNRKPGQDHWQRVIRSFHAIPADNAMAVGQNCVVTIDGRDVEAKVAQVMQQLVPGGAVVYCYRLDSPYSASLGYFYPTQVRSPLVVNVESSSDSGGEAGSSDVAHNPHPPGALPAFTSVFVSSVTRLGTIVRIIPGHKANDFKYEVQYHDSLSSDVDLECVHSQHEMCEFIEAHPKRKRKNNSQSWPKESLSKSAVVYCKDGKPLGGTDGELKSGTGAVTGVALDWHGAPLYYEIQMRFSGFSACDPTGKYYFESKCVSLNPWPVDSDDVVAERFRKSNTAAPASEKRLLPEQTSTPAAHTPAAAASNVCNCYTKCKGICVNAPPTGPRKRAKKEAPLFFHQCGCL